jgi:citrate synthase
LFTKAAKGDSAALQNMDRQIFRLIGKATTLAACVLPVIVPLFVTYSDYNCTCRMAYRIRQGRDFVVPPTGMSYTESYVSIQ